MSRGTLEGVTAYPLTWPAGRKRTDRYARERAKFGKAGKGWITDAAGRQTWSGKQSLTIGEGRDRLLAELERFGATAVVVSSDLRLRLDGLPMASQSQPDDPGVAVYFTIGKVPRVMACDRFDRVADNLAAIGKTIEAQRAMLRYGVVTADQIFEGFRALPDPNGSASGPATVGEIRTVEDAAVFLARYPPAGGLALAPSALLKSAELAAEYGRAAARKLHPDANAGAELPEWAKLQAAKALLETHHAAGVK